MTRSRNFLPGSALGLLLFLGINLLAAHLLSDCGLPALLGRDACADDIARAGFPLIFFEQGGFAFHSTFNIPYLLIDLLSGLALAVFSGIFANWRTARRSRDI